MADTETMAKTNLLEELIELVQRADRYDDEARMALLGYCETSLQGWEEFQAVVTQTVFRT